MYVCLFSYIINPCKYAQQIAFNERRWFLQKRYSQFDKLDQTVLVFVSTYVRACVCSCVRACMRACVWHSLISRLWNYLSIRLSVCLSVGWMLMSCSICLSLSVCVCVCYFGVPMIRLPICLCACLQVRVSHVCATMLLCSACCLFACTSSTRPSSFWPCNWADSVWCSLTRNIRTWWWAYKNSRPKNPLAVWTPLWSVPLHV